MQEQTTTPTDAATTDVQPELAFNGSEPLDEEARLAAQVDTIGEDPQVDPDAKTAEAPAAEAPVATEGEAAAPPAVGDEAAAVAAQPTPAEAAAPPAVAAVHPRNFAEPKPPKDFEAEYQALWKKYDDGDLDAADFQAAQRALTREESAYTARRAVWEEQVRSAATATQADFNAYATQWEAANSDFMRNPMRAQAMQAMINQLDTERPGLPAPELLAQAQRIVFEAFNYTPPAASSPATAEKAKAAIAQASAKRAPGPVPATLSTAPAAAPIQTSGNAGYAELDGMDISDLENALARMTPSQREAFLADAPGSKSTGFA